MALDSESPQTRRAMLAAALGAGAATVASALGRPAIALAGSDGDVVLGAANNAGATTVVNNASGNQSALWGNATNAAGTGVGVRGDCPADSGIGVWGLAPNGHAGVRGESVNGMGVRGISSTGIGVSGQSTDAEGVHGDGKTVGVDGWSPDGRGVAGSSDTGIGCFGESFSKYGVLGHSTLDVGIYGKSGTSVGIWGEASSTTGPTRGVHGRVFSPGGSAILGYSGTGSNPAPAAKTGVFGYADQDSSSRGVVGRSPAGVGVNGESTTGTAALFTTPKPSAGGVHTGYALRAVGRVKLDRCAGLATIAGGTRTEVVSPGIQLEATSAVVATLQGSAGGAVVERVVVNASANTFTIWLTKASTVNVRVAWHVFG